MYDLNDPLIQTLLIGAILTLPLKAYGLWRAAQNNQKGWFVSMLLINSIGLLEVTYLFYFAKNQKKAKTKD